MHPRVSRIALTAAGFVLAAQAAFAAVTIPDCDALRAWSASADPADKSFALAPALTVPAALSDDKLAPVFGAPLLEWTRNDAVAAGKAIAVCSKAAKKARDADAVAAYGGGYQVMAKVAPYALVAVERARGNAAKFKASLDAVPDSPELDRVLQAMLEGDPAAPKSSDYQGLAREAVDPGFRLAKEMAMLPAVDRDPLVADLEARRRRIRAAIGGEADKAIAEATPDRAGIFALMTQRATAAGNNPAADAKLTAKADAIRAELRQADPAAWVPPSCTDLYAWAGAQERNARVPLGRYQILTAFADDAVTPVFNVPLARWSDDDLAAMKTLSGICQAAWQASPGARAVNNPPADAPELVRLASKGRWIDSAEQQLQQGRDLAARYVAAQAAMAAALDAVEALPATTEGLQKLVSMGQPADANMLDDGANKRFAMAVQAKRQAISTSQLEAAVDGLKQVDIAKLDDLPKLINFASRAMGTIADGQGRARFQQAYEGSLAAAISKLFPDFQAAVEKLPESREGLMQSGDAVARFTRVSDTQRAPAFGPLHRLAQARGTLIAEKLREANCRLLWDELDMSEKEAAQAVWGPGKPVTLGGMVCQLAASGMEVHEYDGGGMFSSTQTLKVTMPMGGLQTMSMHKAKVAAGQDEMLVGFKLADANQEKAVPVQEWEMLMHLTGGQIVTRKQCESVMAVSDDRLKAAQRMLALDCAVAATRGQLY